MDHVSAFKTIQSNYNRSMKAIVHKQAKNISSHFDKILGNTQETNQFRVNKHMDILMNHFKKCW